ncbi:MAG: restriction endonuclease subunit S, partial [Enterovibrio sp.]
DSGVEWIGDIPMTWKLLPLKRIFKIVIGSTPRSNEVSFWDGDITWITPADLSKVGVEISASSRNITNEGLNSCGTSLVPKGSLILSTRAPIGTIAIASKDICTNQGCKSLIPSNKVDSKFYYYVISVSSRQLNNLGKGTTFLELSTDELSNFATPYPSFAEQQKIAAFLEHQTAKIDTLVTKQLKAIELMKERRTALISAAVTGKIDVRDWTN